MREVDVTAAAGESRTMDGYSELLDIEAYNKLKELFAAGFLSAIETHTQSVRENVIRAEQAIQQADPELLERAAHSIKGASAQFGAIRLNKLATEIEALAKEGELSSAKSLLAELRVAQERVAELMLAAAEAS